MSADKSAPVSSAATNATSLSRDPTLVAKMTRWDRITRQHLHKVEAQTAQVQRLFGLNFVNERQQRNMNGDYSGASDRLDSSAGGGGGDGIRKNRPTALDPALVMEMRHKMIRSSRQPASSGDGAGDGPQAMAEDAAIRAFRKDRLREHNSKVEERYLDHELRKFEQQLRAKAKPRSVVLKLDNYPSTEEPEPEEQEELELELEQEQRPQQPDSTRESLDFPRDCNGYYEEKVNHIDPFDDQLIAERPSTITFNDYVDVIDFDPERDEGSGAKGSFDSDVVDDDDTGSHLNAARSDEPLRLYGSHINVTAANAEIEMEPTENQQTDTKPSTIFNPPKQNQDKAPPSISVTKLELESRPPTSATAFASLRRPDPIDPQAPSPLPPERCEIVAQLHATPAAQQEAAANQADRQLLQQSFRRWTHYVLVQRMAALNVERRTDSRAHKIEQYLRAIRCEKGRQQAKAKEAEEETGEKGTEGVERARKRSEMSGFAAGVMVKKFSNKLKVQQDIIDLQKLKLERQERLIAELKYSRLADSTRESQAACAAELRDVRRTGCPRSRATARCLQLVGNLHDPAVDAGVGAEYERLQARGTPKFLQDMQARALERNARHREAQERRDRLEREREEQRLAAEAAKVAQDERAKQARIEELRAKRRAERLQREQREQDRLRYLENMRRAEEFNRRRLLRRFGLDVFRALVERKRQMAKRADRFRVFIALRRALVGWRLFVAGVWAEREERAAQCARKQRLRWAWGSWRQLVAAERSRWLVAVDWHAMRLAERMLRHWDGWTRRQKCVEAVRMRQAEAHYEWQLKWRVLDHWRRLRQMLQLERETDERRQRWRVKIWELLPDYRPNATAEEEEV